MPSNDAELSNNNDNAVGFTAYVTGSPRYGPESTIVFDTVVTNYGDFYDGGTGIFICPVKGDYVVFVFVAQLVTYPV